MCTNASEPTCQQPSQRYQLENEKLNVATNSVKMISMLGVIFHPPNSDPINTNINPNPNNPNHNHKPGTENSPEQIHLSIPGDGKYHIQLVTEWTIITC